MKKFRELSEALTPSSKPEPGREAVGGRFTSGPAKRPMKPAPIVTSEENISEIVLPQVKSDLGSLDRVSFVKKHGVTKSAAKQRMATEEKDEEEYDYEGDMVKSDLRSIIANANRIIDMVEDNDNLPEWCQSKVTIAEDYVSTVANYLTAKMDESIEDTIAAFNKNRPAHAHAKIDNRTSAQRKADTQKMLAARAKSKPAAAPKSEIDMSSPEAYYKSKSAAASKPGQSGVGHHYVGDSVEVNGELTEAKQSAAVRLQKALENEKRKREAIQQYTDKHILKKPEPKPVQKEEVEKIEENNSSKSGIVETDVYGTKAYHAKCLEPGCDWQSKRYDRIKQAQTEAHKHAEKHMNKKGVKEDVEQIDEGRPSQRHPLEGHEYHKKSDEALVHIAKDAHEAAEAMKGHNTTAENKYRDQANDSATVRYYRQKHGMADWYKKKYGHMKESFKTMDEPNLNLSIQARQKKADDNKVPFEGPYKKKPSAVAGKHGQGYSTARHLARMALKKQASNMSVKESLEESRKAEIVKDILKKGKKKDENKFEAEPELGTTVVKADN